MASRTSRDGANEVGGRESEYVMYKWLEHELATIQTRKFHIVDGPISPTNRDLVIGSAFGVPNSYKEFVIRFGNARLYRIGGGYAVSVFAVPRSEQVHGVQLLCFGDNGMNAAFFNEAMCSPDRDECPVFEWTKEDGLHETASGFEEWLHRNCRRARNGFSKTRWRSIVQGPPPFSSEESRIIVARRHFRWRKVGVLPNGDVMIEVHNGSAMSLPYLSVGVRTSRFEGGIWLDVGGIAPGSTGVVFQDCYKDLVSPDDVELFAKPDPEPEDRDRYWEFQACADRATD